MFKFAASRSVKQHWCTALVSVLASTISHWSMGLRQLLLCGALLNAAAVAELVSGNFPVLNQAYAIKKLVQGSWPLLQHVDIFFTHLGE